MKHFPRITNEIREAAIEMSEIRAFDITRKKDFNRCTSQCENCKKKRKTSLAVSIKDARRNLEHV